MYFTECSDFSIHLQWVRLDMEGDLRSLFQLGIIDIETAY
ncbi:hypothetical protein TcasGA2_TC031741 [Tribolium castaneum]|uniref:Uncharacterized protein n=1 Tax=Tribolium castaneum TaxID=7070 RepID=A0A139W9N8_TRICA|nr:hypothetical protein TcasGA2_TC031741 [Tribolium castaneum]